MDLASYLDHTLLKEDATDEQLRELCKEAIDFDFKGVCVYPRHLPLVALQLAGKRPLPVAVVDFPSGEKNAEAKAEETAEAIALGAKEIDMVINYKALIQKKYAQVYAEIRAVVCAAGEYPVKVILETCKLNYDEKVAACVLSVAADAAFVKTSTGFGGGGATIEDIMLMRKIVPAGFGVKASGGIRTGEMAIKMIEAGADRIGTSSSVQIIKGGL